MAQKISVIIPSYNESKTLIEVLEQVNKQNSKDFNLEVIFVNDGSTDNTHELISSNKQLVDKYIKLENNSGKGAAVREALSVASGEYIIFQDADLEYNPYEYRKFFNIIKNYSPDLVIGSRFSGSDFTKVMYFWNKVGNKLITLTFNTLFNTTFTDTYSCYLLYRKELVNPLDLKTNGWQQHGEILSTIVKKGFNFYEVPINYNGRSFEEGKKIRARHFVAVIFTIIKKRFK
jgi:glycosyltransferase involved in cell wall biosynthesis